VIRVVQGGLFTAGVAKEFRVSELASGEGSRLTRDGIPVVIVSEVELVGDTEFLEARAGESDIGARDWDQAGTVTLLVVEDGFTVI
jgi:hypothetical protein